MPAVRPFQTIYKVIYPYSALFRPIAMVVPDYSLIAENILYSLGFVQAPLLAKKVYILFKLASEQLTVQGHYDFGMRSIKSVLDIAGEIKRKNHNENELKIVKYLLLTQINLNGRQLSQILEI